MIDDFALFPHQVVDEHCRDCNEQAVDRQEKDYLLHEGEVQRRALSAMSQVCKVAEERKWAAKAHGYSL